ncbi:MAG: helix-turn-helix transcriptional regulator [Lachnospiraceae bacterium]|nr:helix-turn-helix transcriptional regulator [Lachnospiraceae bacterium]
MSHNTTLYETVSHKTASAPYSLHHTQVGDSAEPALYLHWHNEMEFLLLLEGELIFHVEERSFLLRSGDAIFIPPGLLHYATSNSSASVSFRAFVLSPELICSSFDTLTYNTYVLPVMHNNLSYSLVLQNSVAWQADVLLYLQQIFSKESADELYVRGISLLIWNKMYRHHIGKHSTTPTLHALSKQLSIAISYLHNNYHRSITLTELASLIPLSEAQFCRSFKHLTGLTPFRYLVRYRILQSCTELTHTNKKITDIALSCGFNNVSYYNRAFLQIMNMTPSEYRICHPNLYMETPSQM